MKSKKITIIDETKIQYLNDSNGTNQKTLIFINDKKEQFKISIKSETHRQQSYAKLEKWTNEKGFELIVNKNPQIDYEIFPSYSEFNQNKFDVIIKDLVKLSESF